VRPDDVHVVHVARFVLGQLTELVETELPIVGRGFPPEQVPAVELRQKDAESSRLDLVQPRVVADELEPLLVPGTVEAQHPDRLGERLVACRDEASVADAEQVLRREEAECAGDADRPGPAALHGRTECLRGVLDHRNSSWELGERRRAAEEMDGEDRLRSVGHPGGHIGRIEIQRHRIDVREDGCGATPQHGLHGRVERERGADDLVAGPNPHRVQHELDRVGAVRDSDGVRRAQVGPGLFLEGADVRPEDEARRFEHLVDRRPDRRKERLVLRLHVYERDPHWESSVSMGGPGFAESPSSATRCQLVLQAFSAMPSTSSRDIFPTISG
jgi:hypothetical protein